MSPPWRRTFTLALIVLYISIFLSRRDTPGMETGALLILPTMAAGWTLGLRAGLVASLLSILVNSLLLMANKSADWSLALRGTSLLEVTSVVLAGIVAGYMHDVNVRTQRKLSEHQILEDTLRRGEQWFKSFCERAQLGYQALNETGHLIEVNQAWLDTFGYTREGVIGRWFGDFLAPDYQALFREWFPRFKAAGDISGVVFEVTCRDGERRVVSLDGRIGTDGLGKFQQAHCILADVGERKRVEEGLRAQRDRAQQYLDIAGVMLVALNTDQTIALINRKGCEILGCKEERLVGKNWFDLFIPERIRDEVKRVFEVLLSGDVEGVEYFENPVVTQAGEERLIAWYNTILTDASGRITGMLSSGEDITERKRMEENLRQAHDELEVRVQERTVELSRANELLQQEIAERKRAEAAEKEQRALAEALRDTAAALNSTLNLEEVLDQILANLERVVQHRTGNIMLVEGDWARIVRWRGYDAHVPDEEMRSVQLPMSDTASLRWMVETGQPLIIADVAQYQGWAKLKPNAWIRSYAGAPIRSGGQVIGFINLDSAEPGYFKPIHAEGLRAFVDQAAIAIENARLYSQAQALATLEERNRIAHDLHDAVSQTLWSACLIADGLPAVWDSDPDEGRQNLKTLHQMTRGALAEMRTLLLELRPAALTEVDLGELLRQLTQAFTGRTKIPVTLTVQGRHMLPANVQVALYRITQEALNNIGRHAAASQVNIYLHDEPGMAELRISDNGIGFSPDSIPPGHLGLGIMSERAESIGARLKIDSRVGHGTTVEIIWIES